MRKIPPLRALQVFEAAARQTHFSKAADELCITQSAVSHQVRVLEDYFGEPLFDRRGRKLQLTPKGQELFIELERIFNELSDLNLKIGNSPNQPLCLAVYSSFAVKWLVPRLADFRRQHPSVKIRLEMLTQDPDLRTSSADIFIASKLNQRGYWQQLLHKERLIPVCSPS
ncbi:MAG: LysR family transcriptional regulator, partial [Shewanella sp.]